MRKSFVIYTDIINHLNKLSDEQTGRLFKAIVCSQRDMELPEMDGMTDMLFGVIKDQIDRDGEAYEKVCETRREAGRKGGNAKAANSVAKASFASEDVANVANASFASEILANVADTDTVTDTDTDTDTDKDYIHSLRECVGEADPLVVVSEGDDAPKSNTNIAKPDIPYKAIIDHLNEKTGKRFSPTVYKTVAHINARFTQGYTLEDFISVIDRKVAEWKDNPKMHKYLRPETLFCEKNFDAYINENDEINAKPPDIQSAPRARPNAFVFNETTRQRTKEEWLEIERQLLGVHK